MIGTSYLFESDSVRFNKVTSSHYPFIPLTRNKKTSHFLLFAMGTASKVISVLLRIFELCCAGIVLGILGHFFHVLHLGNGSADGRLVYAEVIAGLSVAFSILLVPPLTYSFYAFPLDLAIFICWMVAFGLLDNVSSLNPDYVVYWLTLNPSLRPLELVQAFGIGTIGVITGAGFGIFRTAPLISLSSALSDAPNGERF